MPPGRRGARRAARISTRRMVRRVRRRIVRRTIMVRGMMVLAASGGAAAVNTGLPPQQLEDKDLDQAMQELSIQSQPLTAEDQAALVE